MGADATARDAPADRIGEKLPGLGAVVRRSGIGWYPLAALGALAASGVVGAHALAVLLPDIGRTLGIGPAGLGAMLTGQLLASALVALPLAGVVQRRAIRALLAVGGAGVSAVLLASASLALGPGELAVAVVAMGVAEAVVAVAHQPLVVELYPPEGRVRALSVLAGSRGAGEVLAPLVVGVLVTVAGLTWRGVFLAAGVVMALATVVAARLRDPGFGRWDQTAPARNRHDGVGHPPLDLGVAEASRRLHAIPTLRRLFAFQAGLGVMLLPFLVFLVLFLEIRWRLGPWGRGVVLSSLGVAAVVAVAMFGRVGERLFRDDPPRLVTVAGRMWCAALALVVVAALAPTLGLVVVALAVAVGLVAAIGPGLAILHLSLVPPRLRSTSSALASLWFAGAGGPIGILLFGAADRRYGLHGALVATTVPGLVAVLLLRSARTTVVADLARTTAGRSEASTRPHGRQPPALAVRGLEAGHDDQLVLRGVDLVVEPGERVALLGVNGAGKTTLLHALGGLLLPWAGVVHVDGRDVTHLDAERRPARGLVLVDGPTAVFDPLTVDEHLRLYLQRSGLAPGAASGPLDEISQQLPHLADRRGVAARDLSGGERRMLGLARAMLVSPRVLLVDELTLGLSPAARDRVLEAVRGLAERGAAVVVVDQSPWTAAAVCDRAVVLVRGEVGYDGPIAALAGRPELLPSVFLPEPS